MKTNLDQPITNADEAKAYLTELFNNGESYHPEDDANDIIWTDFEPTEEELNRLNENMELVYKVADFDPCGFLLKLMNDAE